MGVLSTLMNWRNYLYFFVIFIIAKLVEPYLSGIDMLGQFSFMGVNLVLVISGVIGFAVLKGLFRKAPS